jgi:hypothetical protein
MMPRPSRRAPEAGIVALAVLASPMFVAHCGSRTGLGVPGDEPDAAAPGALSNSGAPPGTVLCSARLGPVSTCLGTDQSGGVVACSSDFPYCIRPPGYSAFVCCSGPGPINGPGGSCPGPGAQCPVFRSSLAFDAGADGVSDPCLPDSVVAGSDGLPECVVVAARLTAGTATAAQIDACARCDAPGLGLLPVGRPAWVLSSELAQYACLCRIDAVSPCPVAESEGLGAASWCFRPQAAASGCGGAALHVDLPPVYDAAVYVACFAAD